MQPFFQVDFCERGRRCWALHLHLDPERREDVGVSWSEVGPGGGREQLLNSSCWHEVIGPVILSMVAKLIPQLLIDFLILLNLPVQTLVSLFQLLHRRLTLLQFSAIGLLFVLTNKPYRKLSNSLDEVRPFSLHFIDKVGDELTGHLALILLDLVQLVISVLLLLQAGQLRF